MSTQSTPNPKAIVELTNISKNPYQKSCQHSGFFILSKKNLVIQPYSPIFGIAFWSGRRFNIYVRLLPNKAQYIVLSIVSEVSSHLIYSTRQNAPTSTNFKGCLTKLLAPHQLNAVSSIYYLNNKTFFLYFF